VQQRNFGHDAGVVDQNVYPPERIDRLSDKRRHSVLVANVARHRNRSTSKLLDFHGLCGQCG
jgi:hypothetical protein